ncbi:MAG: HNH endonuclease, partial [Sulfurovum sp.]|nr:HNH endonuclease [Sulfurovum sp.]
MTKSQKYLEALKTFDDWVIVSEWAVRVGELYPDILEAANEQAANQANDTTGLRELAARISSRLSTGRFPEVEIDDSERPRRVRYISEAQKEERIEEELEADIEPLTRAERIRQDTQALTEIEHYRIEEFETIAKQLNKFFSLDFEV